MTTTAELIARFESFGEHAYWDVNHWRIGYGSDTEGPDQINVVEGMTTTKNRALQNLAMRIQEFQIIAIYGSSKHPGMGADVWKKLTENQKSALTSITYNYGRLPVTVTVNDPAATAAEIRAREGDNGGVNRKRRTAEAAFYLTPDEGEPQAAPSAAIPQAPAPQVPSTLPPMPAPPAGIPLPPSAPIPASAAARQTAFRKEIGAYRDVLTAEQAALNAEFDAEIAALDKMVGEDSGRPAAASAAALQIPTASPAETTTQGNQTVNSVFGITNWKTTLGGIAAILSALGAGGHAISTGDMSSAYESIPAILAGISLIAAKDSNVTGGSVAQTVEAQQRAKSSPLS
jgi:GH24 family phage-related lysozyme (muramidase)